ncbi:MAG: VWA domain-containing protein [Phycisphaeraceae bacterium]|nr:VWA domain-containing protein [Phycisphaeraceae bacterium]
MMRRVACVCWIGLLATSAWAQHEPAWPADSIIIVPQRRVIPVVPDLRGAVEITRIAADIRIDDQSAVTSLDVFLSNPTSRRIEAQVLLSVPAGAVVRQFGFQGSGSESTAKLLPRDEARRIYERIVSQMRDPALLEFVDCDLVRSSVFPVEPRGTQQVHLTYENLLILDGDRMDYVLPRSQAIDYRIPWDVTLTIRGRRAVASLYSPSHELVVKRAGAGETSASLASSSRTRPGSLRICVLREKQGDDAAASVLTYPDPTSGGGYFLLLLSPPAPPEVQAGIEKRKVIREVTLVYDRSGSMAGGKLQQVREAALQVVAGLDHGERFNIIAYNDSIERMAETPLVKDDASLPAATVFLDRCPARGGTNIHDALVEALHPRADDHALPIVLFLTDGLPTAGPTSETVLRDLVEKGNPHHRRIFTFGVGVDVNTPLLDRIADASRGRSTFVLPGEDVELAVAGVFKRLTGPVLTDPVLSCDDHRVKEVMPATLPDLFAGDQLVVVGRYAGEQPVTLHVAGNVRGTPRSFHVVLDPRQATTRNAFVGRLWAGRRIAFLTDALRALGADPSKPVDVNDPKVRELVDEVVKLSLEFGILTPYTAFLAREGTDLAHVDNLRRQAEAEVAQPAMSVRSGAASVSQDVANAALKSTSAPAPVNEFRDASLRVVRVDNVQQIAGGAYFRQGDQWVDNRLVQKPEAVRNAREIVIGSAEYWKLVDELAAQGRQSLLSVDGEIVFELDGQAYRIR